MPRPTDVLIYRLCEDFDYLYIKRYIFINAEVETQFIPGETPYRVLPDIFDAKPKNRGL